MATNFKLTTLLLLFVAPVCLAQQQSVSQPLATLAYNEFPQPHPIPHVVIQVDQTFMDLTEPESEKFLREVKKGPLKGVVMVRSLSLEDAKAKYGVLGRNGVMIVKYKDVYKLPWELQMRFVDLK